MPMKPFAGLRSLALLAGIMFGSLVVPAAAQAPELAMLDGLSKGAWELRFWGEDRRERICLRTGRELIQLRHKGAQCSQFVVEDGAGEVTVQYTCPGNGYGNTSIRRESAQLVQISSQGIEGGRPFNFRAEARRVGSC